MEHPLISAYLQKIEREESIPTVPPVPNTDTTAYFEVIERRFANPKIGDTMRRLAFDGSSRQPKFVIPAIADRLASGQSVEGLALATATWARYCAGRTESGKPIEPNDPIWDRLTERAEAARADPAAWLAMRDIYGATADAPAFAEPFARWLRALWSDGTEATLRRYLG
jgi:mannitol 2-dehydrogenase